MLNDKKIWQQVCDTACETQYYIDGLCDYGMTVMWEFVSRVAIRYARWLQKAEDEKKYQKEIDYWHLMHDYHEDWAAQYYKE